jgi:hypothetical protein
LFEQGKNGANPCRLSEYFNTVRAKISHLKSGLYNYFQAQERIFTMPNYKKLYFKLFNQITDMIEMLKQIQIDAEDAYIEDDEIDTDKIKKFIVHSNNKEEK